MPHDSRSGAPAAGPGRWWAPRSTACGPSGRQGLEGDAMTQMAGPERQARTDTDQTWRMGAAAAAALDQLDRATAADEAYDHYLERLHTLDADVREGTLSPEDL